MAEQKADIALIGLAVMGQNLILNMNDHGWVVCAYNRTQEKVDKFLANEAKGTQIIGARSLKDMVAKLKTPRKVMMLVRAGSAVDDFIEQLVPLLEAGDCIIDGGNSEYQDTERRCKSLADRKLLYIGTGVSGGEEGARYGPSIMPGGNPDAWPLVKDILQSISARVGPEPCCDWVGDGGAGHYVKMVHNGIEYGDMQLISEAYHLMTAGLGMESKEMSQVFSEWNKGDLDSFLIEITANILAYEDDQGALVPRIRDVAGQKGTGKWTAISALEYGCPVTLIAESVMARCLSAIKDERVATSAAFEGSPVANYCEDKPVFLEKLRQALYASKIVSYAQGFMLLREAAKNFGWKLNYGAIALMWRGGCIIRSRFLGEIKAAFDKNPELTNLLRDDFFTKAIKDSEAAWRDVVCSAFRMDIPVPAMASARTFFTGLKCETLPANLIQAQRDYFGAHTYELAASPGKWHHTNWTGTGGNVASTTYQA